MILTRIGTRYTLWQVIAMVRRARRVAILREDAEITAFIEMLRG